MRVLVDAEYTYINPALSLITMAMMAQCNRQEPWIWNTYQCYLKVLPVNYSLDMYKLRLPRANLDKNLKSYQA